LVVGVGDGKVGRAGDLLVTHALGSCLGLLLYDGTARVGGLLHAMLPEAKINPQKAAENPFMFVDRGVPLLFEKVYALGAQRPRLVIKAAGCAAPLQCGEMFRIGERNHTILKMLLGKNGLLLAAEDVGGTMCRTLQCDMSTGKVVVSSGGREHEL